MTARAPMQLGLFAGDPETRRLVDGLTCLRDAVPEAMYVLLHLADWRPRDERNIGASGDWAYSIRRGGLRFEHQQEWWWDARRQGEKFGWDRTPAQVITWEELTAHLGDDPRRAAVAAWADTLIEPAWQELLRPHELWPNPGSWHPDYIRHDHERPGWRERIAAWRTLQAICTDAMTKVSDQ